LQNLSIFDNVETSPFIETGFAMPSSYAIGEYFESFIKDQIQQGRYASASEVVRDGLRALEEREQLRAVKLASLRAELQRGADSGVGVPAKKVFAAARKRIESRNPSGQRGR
jgi:antitoxin ParD1/3/4